MRGGKIPILAQSYGFFVAYSSPPFVMIVRGECRANESLDFTCFFSTKIGELSLSEGALKEAFVGGGNLVQRRKDSRLLPSWLFSARSRRISSLRRRVGEYRVKYFLFLPKMFFHFWLRNKKVLGRKGARFCLRKSRILGRIFVTCPLGWKSRCLLMEGLFGNGKVREGRKRCFIYLARDRDCTS